MVLRLLFTFFSISFLFGQNIRVYDVEMDSYPILEAKFVSIKSSGEQDLEVSPESITISENGLLRDIIDITCPELVQEKPVSAVLTIDVSRSMEGEGLALALSGARKWVEIMKDDTETAINIFSDIAIVMSDFTSNKSDLNSALDGIDLIGGTNFDRAFLGSSGALSLAENAVNDPVIILLTDGQSKGDVERIINEANELNARVYSIVLYEPAKNNLKEISQRTGGLVFENVTNFSEIQAIYATIFGLSQSVDACKISWVSSGCELDRNLKVELDNLSSTTSFQTNLDQLAGFDYPDGRFVFFSGSEVGRVTTSTIKIIPVKSSTSIEGIVIENPNFRLSNFDLEDFPIFVEKDSILELEFEYSQLENKFETSTVEILSNACFNNTFYLTGGTSGGFPNTNAISLIEPNGGELYASNTDSLIKWEGSFPNEEILFEFTTDNGIRWQTIESNIQDETNPINYPNIDTDQAKVRLTQFSIDSGSEYLQIVTENNFLNSVNWSPDNTKLLLADKDGRLSIYSAVNGEFMTSGIFHDGQAFDAVWAPDGLRIVSVGEDGDLVVVNTLNMEILIDQNLSSTALNTVDWSLDANRIIAGGENSDLYLLDGNNFELSETVRAHNKAITKVRFDAEVERVISSSKDSLVKVWDLPRLELISDQILVNGEVTSFDWFENQNQIIATNNRSGINDISVWDLITNTKLDNTSGPEPLFAGSYNNIDNIFVAGGVTGLLYLYDNDLSKHSLEFPQLTNDLIKDIEWSPSGDRFVIVTEGNSERKSLKFFSSKQYPINIFESAETFSIKKTEIEAQDIDFGNRKLGRTYELTQSDFITSIGPANVKILDIQLENNFFGVFSLDRFDQVDVNESTPLSFKFYFTPDQERNYSADLQIQTSIGPFRAKLRGNGIEGQLSDLEYDFGEITVGKDSSAVLYLVNNSSSDVNINNLKSISSSTYFTIVEPEAISSLIVPSNDSIPLKLRFMPGKPGKTSTLFVLEFGNSNVYIDLTGRGVQPVLEIETSPEYSQNCFEESVFSFNLENTGLGLLQIYDIKTEENVELGKSSTTLGESSSFTVNFTLPYQTENKQLEFEFVTNQYPDSIQKIEIEIEMLETRLEVATNTIDFLQFEENLAESISIEVTNTGETDLYLTSEFDVLIPDQNKLRVTYVGDNPLPIGTTGAINFEYLGGSFNDTGKSEFLLQDTCGNSELIEINWEVNPDTPDLIIGNISDTTATCPKEMLILIPILNTTDVAVTINQLDITNSQFELIEAVTIDSQSENNLILRLNYDSQGEFNTSFNFEHNGIMYSDEISVTILDIEHSFNQKNISINLDPTSQNVFEMQFNNESNVPIDLPIGSVFSEIRLNSSDINPVPANSSAQLEFEKITNQSGLDTVFFDLSCFGNNDTLFVESVITDKPFINLSIPTLTYKIGEKFTIPIEVEKVNFEGISEISEINLQLNYNQTLMQPENLENEIILSSSASFNLGSIGIESDEFSTLPFTVLWGNDSTTVLDLTVLNSEYPVFVNSGLLRVADLCYEGGARLYFSNNINLNVSQSQSEIIINYEELPDTMSIRMVNLVSGFNKEINHVNQNQIIINKSDFNSGAYVLEIEINGFKTHKKVIISN